MSGCANRKHPVTDNTPITLTLATFNKFGYSDAMLAQFHTLHPNVTVVQNIAATSQAAQDNMFTKLAAGSGLGDVEAVEVGLDAEAQAVLETCSSTCRHPIPRAAGSTGKSGVGYGQRQINRRRH